MIEFLKCVTFCEEKESENRLTNLVNNLNTVLGNKSCNCHPDKTWKIGVDQRKDCNYAFHPAWKENPNCDFYDKLINKEVKEFITNQ